MVLIVSSFPKNHFKHVFPFLFPSIQHPPFITSPLPPYVPSFAFTFPIPFTVSTPSFPLIRELILSKLKCPDAQKTPSKIIRQKKKLMFFVCYPNYHLPSVKKTFRMVKRTISAFQLSLKDYIVDVLLTFRILFSL